GCCTSPSPGFTPSPKRGGLSTTGWKGPFCSMRTTSTATSARTPSKQRGRDYGLDRIPPIPVAASQAIPPVRPPWDRSEEHTSELQSRENLVCRLLLEKKNDSLTTPKYAVTV